MSDDTPPVSGMTSKPTSVPIPAAANIAGSSVFQLSSLMALPALPCPPTVP